MFNSEQKQKYIDYMLEKSVNENANAIKDAITNFFIRISKAEREIGKDCAEMNVEEAKELITSISTIGQASIDRTISMIATYVKWCKKNGLTSQQTNSFSLVKSKEIQNNDVYVNGTVKDEAELVKYLDEILQETSEDSIDNMYRVALLLLFAGLSSREVLHLREEDVDLDTDTICHKGHTIKISETLGAELKNYMNMPVYTKRVGHNKDMSLKPITRTGYVLENSARIIDKMVEGYRDNTFEKTLKVGISKRLTAGNKKISQNNIVISGIFSRMYKTEIETGQIDMTEYFRFKGKNVGTIAHAKKVEQNARTEYASWKKAFGI